mmetsp:Transcript_28892/g.46361  ORF Transcript_28892/g.46361 Transcript_28892/m.46361 type:complete len:132 (-) Transcript_28892:253-648(-)
MRFLKEYIHQSPLYLECLFILLVWFVPCSMQSLLPTLEILAPNIDPEDLMRIEKPCHRIMTKFALFPAPKTPTPSSGFGLWYWSVILQQLFCCCHYYTKRNRDPVPYSKDGPVLVDRARLKKVKIMFDDAK